MLYDFLTQHRDALLERARAKVAARRVPAASSDEVALGVPAFLAQVAGLLRDEERTSPATAVPTTDSAAEAAMGPSADRHGDAQLRPA